MTLQLHHLHTDGPKPLYKKITADEYDRLNSRNAELERMDTEHTLQIAKMNGYIHHLEEERRWRKCCEELPLHDTWCLVYHEGEIDVDHYTDDCNSYDRFVMYGYYVTHWMPLPSAPKEEK